MGIVHCGYFPLAEKLKNLYPKRRILELFVSEPNPYLYLICHFFNLPQFPGNPCSLQTNSFPSKVRTMADPSHPNLDA